MSVLNQKEGVYQAIVSIMGEWDDSQPIQLDKEQREHILEVVTSDLLAGNIEMTDEARAKHNDEASMRKYVRGLLNNWLRKDLRLNGGTPYETKNPGSRAGAGDDMVRELKKLLKLQTPGSEAHAEVKKALDARIAEVKASKVEKVEINVDILPDELKHLAK